jgi:hypothetical protein
LEELKKVAEITRFQSVKIYKELKKVGREKQKSYFSLVRVRAHVRHGFECLQELHTERQNGHASDA